MPQGGESGAERDSRVDRASIGAYTNSTLVSNLLPANGRDVLLPAEGVMESNHGE